MRAFFKLQCTITHAITVPSTIIKLFAASVWFWFTSTSCMWNRLNNLHQSSIRHKLECLMMTVIYWFSNRLFISLFIFAIMLNYCIISKSVIIRMNVVLTLTVRKANRKNIHTMSSCIRYFCIIIRMCHKCTSVNIASDGPSGGRMLDNILSCLRIPSVLFGSCQSKVFSPRVSTWISCWHYKKISVVQGFFCLSGN